MQEKIIGILNRTISFSSVSAVSNLDIATYCFDYLKNQGADVTLVPNGDGSKASVLASFGPIDRPGIVLSAHTDVVPVDGQDWTYPPFSGTLVDGRVYGRGATDMKGFLAVVLAHAESFAANAVQAPVHVALSYDEEVGCRGAPDLVARVAELPGRPVLCIVGEPTSLRVVRAHKGKLSWRVTVTGRGGHSALPHLGVNAVTAASRLVTALDAYGRELRAMRSADPFDSPWTTLHVGSLHGGSALNLIPDGAVFEFELRLLPGADTSAIRTRIGAIIDEERQRLAAEWDQAGIAFEEIASYPALHTDIDDPAVALAARLAEDSGEAGVVSFGTEAGIYSAVGIPTVVCGPGDIRRAHKADEWIGVDELMATSQMMTRVAALVKTGW